MYNKSSDKQQEVICPCCNELRHKKSLSHLFKWRKQYNSPTLGVKENYKEDEEERLRWACDICIKTKKAILAKPEKQDYSILHT